MSAEWHRPSLSPRRKASAAQFARDDCRVGYDAVDACRSSLEGVQRQDDEVREKACLDGAELFLQPELRRAVDGIAGQRLFE